MHHNESWIELFPIFLFKRQLKNHNKINQAIYDHVVKLYNDEDYKYMKKSIKGSDAWQSNFSIIDSECIEQLKPFLIKSIKESCILIYGYNLSFEVTLWVNSSPKYCYNSTHAHPGCQLAGVYYVRIPKIDIRSGILILRHPFGIHSESLGRMYNNIEIIPQEGDLYLFDANLSHEVTRNESDNWRISVSFNIRFNLPMITQSQR